MSTSCGRHSPWSSDACPRWICRWPPGSVGRLSPSSPSPVAALTCRTGLKHAKRTSGSCLSDKEMYFWSLETPKMSSLATGSCEKVSGKLLGRPVRAAHPSWQPCRHAWITPDWPHPACGGPFERIKFQVSVPHPPPQACATSSCSAWSEPSPPFSFESL